MKNKLEDFLRNNYPLIFIFLVGFVLIIGPFLVRNNLQGFDTAGQLASVYYIRQIFWPWPGGWNSMFLAGFPQGLIYTPFFHWLAATLSFLLPIKIAFKTVLSLAIIIFPIIYFFLSKKLFKNSLMAGFALLIASVFYYFDLGLNDNLFSDLYFGMSPHLFSLTLMFAYLYSLYIFEEKPKLWYWPSIFLALSVTTHVFTGMAVALFSLIYLLLSYKNAELFKNLLKQIFLAALLSMWWWLPFILNINYVTGSDIGSVVPGIMILIMPIVLVVNFISLFKKDSDVFLKTVSIFSSIIIISFLIGRLYPVSYFPIHFSRFLVYPLLLMPIQLVYVISSQKINWHRLNVALIFVFGFYFFFFKITPVGPFDAVIINEVDKIYKTGRAIVTGDSRFLDDRFHVTRAKLAIEEKVPTSEGLFVESSVNGWFIMSLMKSWESTQPTFVWAYDNLKDAVDLKWATNIFGINYEYRINDKKPSKEMHDLSQVKERLLVVATSTEKIATSTDITSKEVVEQEDGVKEKLIMEKSKTITDIEKREKEKEKNIQIYHEREKRNLLFKSEKQKLIDDERLMSIFPEGETPFYYQSFYKINDTTVAEALSLRPVDINNDWRKMTEKWWTTDWLVSSSSLNYAKPVLVYRKDTKNWNLAEKDTNLEVKEIGKKMNKFTVNASAFKESVPIYVKVSYFPFWQAFDDKGNKLEIYKTSPNFMMVYGKGVITFKYIEPWYYYFAFIASGVGLLYFCFRLIKDKLQK